MFTHRPLIAFWVGDSISMIILGGDFIPGLIAGIMPPPESVLL
jgi:hypothetical protein